MEEVGFSPKFSWFHSRRRIENAAQAGQAGNFDPARRRYRLCDWFATDCTSGGSLDDEFAVND